MPRGARTGILILAAAALAGACSTFHEADEEATKEDASAPDSAITPEGAPPVDATLDAAPDGPSMAGCTVDQDCGGAGTCFHGLCMCVAGAWVQKDGRCDVPEPPMDCLSAGGTCKQLTSKCEPPAVEGTAAQTTSCGDFVQSICCIPTCHGPDDFGCCAASVDSPTPPICVNTWRTCEPGSRAVNKGDSCAM